MGLGKKIKEAFGTHYVAYKALQDALGTSSACSGLDLGSSEHNRARSRKWILKLAVQRT